METNLILKKEDKLRYCKSFINIKPGTLVLTTTELYFLARPKDTRVLSIPLADILSVNCKRDIGYGQQNMFVFYKDGTKEKKVKIQHASLASWATGALSRLENLYFASWEQAINDARAGRYDKQENSDFSGLDKLAELKDRGVITEEEFTAKKKQMLGL